MRQGAFNSRFRGLCSTRVAFLQIRRLYSRTNDVLELVKATINALSGEYNPEGRTTSHLLGALTGEEDQLRSLVKLVNELSHLLENPRHHIMNEILCSALAHDFSLYYHVPENHQWSKKAIKSLILANPGRAMSTWELLEKHNVNPDDEILEVLVERALFGERYEQEEDAVQFSGMHIFKAIELFNSIKEPSILVVNLLLDTLVDQNALCALKYARVDRQILKEKLTSPEMPPLAYLRISLVLMDDPSIFSIEALSKLLLSCYKKDTPSFQEALASDAASCKQLQKYFDDTMDTLDPQALLEKVIRYIEDTKLDSSKDAESLLLRLELVRAYGIYMNDIQAALRKFHHYQTHDKFGLEFVQLNLQQAFCYQAVSQGNQHHLKVAETLTNPNHIAVTSLTHLILGRAAFDIDTSLELYNDYIQNVSKKVNSVTNRSPAGQLTEALMLAYLYNNDREFAHVILDGAVALKTVSDEHEIVKLRALFKVYGDAWKDDTWESAQPVLKQVVLLHIRQ